MSHYFYSVRENDTLPIIANKFVGDSNRWPELVQSNLQDYPTKLINISGSIIPTFKDDLFVGQKLYLPGSWLGANSGRTTVNVIKNYGYSFDIYRFDNNPRIWTHDKPFDYLLIERIFGCKNVNQYRSDPYKKGEDLRTCHGEPGMYEFYGWNERIKELWGANLDKEVIKIPPQPMQDYPFYKLNLRPGDIVKIPASWPDYKQCDNRQEFDSVDNLNKYVVPLTEGTDSSTPIKLYLRDRHNSRNRFWTADRNTTDYTAFDVADYMTDGASSCCEQHGIKNCFCLRRNDMGPFLGAVPNTSGLFNPASKGNSKDDDVLTIGDLLDSVSDIDISGIEIVKANLQSGELVLAGEGSEIIASCSKQVVADINSDPKEYKRLLDKYGSDDAIADVIVKKCKELNADLIKEQEGGDKKESSKVPLILFGLGMVGIVGGIIVLAVKD